jgi:hypothetical protein
LPPLCVRFCVFVRQFLCFCTSKASKSAKAHTSSASPPACLASDPLAAALRQFLYFCTGEARNLSTQTSSCSSALLLWPRMLSVLYFCTSKASKLSTHVAAPCCCGHVCSHLPPLSAQHTARACSSPLPCLLVRGLKLLVHEALSY